MNTLLRTVILALGGVVCLLVVNQAYSAPHTGIRRLGYAIQIGAFADVKNAERFSATLQKKGIEAFYFRKDSGIYAVRFGDFPSKEKARSIAAKLVTDQLIDGYYIAPPNEIVFSDTRKTDIQKQSQQNSGHHEKDITYANRSGSFSDGQRKKKIRKERDMGFIAARTAERFVGIPYRWGGDTVVDGMDCSGFVRAVYNLCGVSIPRTSREQFKTGESVTKTLLLDGDLVFFGASDEKINHVGIYVGNGKFVHAPRRGEDIRITSIEDTYFEKRFVGARRYFQ